MIDRPQDRKAWSAEDVAELEAMVAKGIDVKQIACALGRTEQAVETKLWRLAGGQPGRSARTRKARQRRTADASFFLS